MSKESSSEGGPHRDADEAFAEFLFLTETGVAPDFEQWCASFSGDVSALRELHRYWLQLSKVLSEGSPDPSALDAACALRDELAHERPTYARYEREEELARGGMGSIHRVWDKDLGRHLAMKVVLSPLERGGPQPPGSASRQLGRFLEEAKVTGQLDHPGIVAVHDLGVDDEGRCFFTMKLVRGVDLKEVFARHRAGDPEWPLQRLISVLLKVCDAVAYAHSKGVIHRDLKPANIMVGRFGEVYVMDWGLARVLDKPDSHDLRLQVSSDDSGEVRDMRSEKVRAGSPVLTMDGHIVGTPSYISPEQAQGRVDELGPRSDVYSLGATLYHLLTGTPPYVPPGEDLAAQRVLLLALHGPPKPAAELAPKVPLELAAICDRAMSRDPLERYAGAAELGHDLRAFLEGRVVKAFRGGALWELRKWIARNPALAGAVALAVLLAVAFSTNEALELAQENRMLANVGREALAGERVASAEREALDEESAELVRNLRASDEVLLEELIRSARELPAPSPDSAKRHQAWLRSARSLYGRLPLHRSLLTRLQAAGAAAWELRPLQRLIQDLADFGERRGAALHRIEARAALAETILEDSLESLDARAAWAKASAEVRAGGHYPGLQLTPQLGLFPLGADPASGLQEFAALTTGSAPARGPRGELLLTPESAVVLVLLPAQTFFMGAQAADPSARNFDPWAEASEAPVHEVELPATFIAKHELTRAQWARLSGAPLPPPSLALNPACEVTWRAAQAVLQSAGLELPSEALWEAAARAGTSTPWWTGSEAASLAGAAHLEADHATAVHTGRANPFGLHQVLGNAAEWCADVPRAYVSGSPLAEGAARVFRGGSFSSKPGDARSADRYAGDGSSGAWDRGLRVSRGVE